MSIVGVGLALPSSRVGATVRGRHAVPLQSGEGLPQLARPPQGAPQEFHHSRSDCCARPHSCPFPKGSLCDDSTRRTKRAAGALECGPPLAFSSAGAGQARGFSDPRRKTRGGSADPRFWGPRLVRGPRKKAADSRFWGPRLVHGPRKKAADRRFWGPRLVRGPRKKGADPRFWGPRLVRGPRKKAADPKTGGPRYPLR